MSLDQVNDIRERRIAWFHCFAGIAGDMALASLVDAGAELDAVRDLLRRVPIGGWHIERKEVLRGGIAASQIVVEVDDEAVVRTHAHIAGLITEARLPRRVAARALSVFEALAKVEARLHRRPTSQIHFHEVGGHDAVIDVVGTAAALELLGVDEVRASPVTTGSGTISTAHGRLPNPPPAVVQLLWGAPVRGIDVTYELTTPTGAALLAALAKSYGPLPGMHVETSGFGAGSRDLPELPNCTQVVIGTTAAEGTGDDGQPVTVLEVNVDDVTGEQLAVAVRELLDAGAHDAWVTPIVMKKGRPGSTVHALSDPDRVPALRRILRRSTGSFGVRAFSGTRWPVAREMTVVLVEGEPVRMKVTAERAKPELEDIVALSARTGISVRELQARAQSSWEAQQDSTPEVPDESPSSSRDPASAN